MTRLVFYRMTPSREPSRVASVWAKQGDPIPRAGEYVFLKNIAPHGDSSCGTIVRNVRWNYDGQELIDIEIEVE